MSADCSQNGLDHPSVDVTLEDSTGILVDGFERTYDGKLKCRYCNYATRGTARLIEHIRIHTGKCPPSVAEETLAVRASPLTLLFLPPAGEKPHRCHLCPFASAYERHLEAHMRSHTGEKPYKCELCSFRCSDRSNLSHHRRRRHKLLPMKGARSLSHKKMLSVLQKKATSYGYGRRLLINFSPPSMVVHKADDVSDFSHELPHLQQEAYDGPSRATGSAAVAEGHQSEQNHRRHDVVMDNPLNQLSTLAGQLSSLPSQSESHSHSHSQPPVSPGAESMVDEKPFLIQQPHPATAPVASMSHASSSSPITPEPRAPPHSSCSPGAGPCSEHSGRTSTPSVSNSRPSTPAAGLSAPLQEPHTLHHCQHCDIYFPDNILYTIHMGCHGYENPYQCNICGHKCKSKYDFACHFARGQHK